MNKSVRTSIRTKMIKSVALLAVTLCATLSIATSASAAGKETKAYKKMLKAGTFSVYEKFKNKNVTYPIQSYLILDIDKNGVKELLISQYEIGKMTEDYDVPTLYVYTYKDSKIVELGGIYGVANPGWGKTAVEYNKKYKTLLSTHHPLLAIGSVESYCYALEDEKIVEKYYLTDYWDKWEDKNSYTYAKNKNEKAKSVTEKKYTSLYKKYYTGKNVKTLYMKTNSYLKK